MKLKKWVALLLVCVMALMGTSCVASFYDHVLTVDGEEISTGMYLMMQQIAYNEAQSKVEDQEKSVLKQKVDGQSAKKWIQERTEEMCRKMVAVERLCAEKGVKLSENSLNEINQTMQSYWSYLEEGYAAQGISEHSFQHYLAISGMTTDLFNELYKEGGEKAPPDDELRAQYAEEYAHLKYISIPAGTDAEGNDVSDQVAEYVDRMVKEMNGGAEFEAVVAGSNMKAIYDLLGRDFAGDTIAESISSSYYREYTDDSGMYTQEFLDELKAQAVGSYGAYKSTNITILYQKIEMFESDEAYTEMRSTIVHDLCFEDFEADLKAIYDEYPVSKVFLAEWTFRPSKLE